jgi:hypothetical protein
MTATAATMMGTKGIAEAETVAVFEEVTSIATEPATHSNLYS